MQNEQVNGEEIVQNEQVHGEEKVPDPGHHLDFAGGAPSRP